ncbi:unnamed protein product [Prunus armeniaca]|uniref:Uncharacterized protein n=1 Tax=Prunus armeniaca TaxID=36596 RepID=A0A6J5UV56_PRUAR|nr:unnamed protein product [Prunus armeniaca]
MNLDPVLGLRLLMWRRSFLGNLLVLLPKVETWSGRLKMQCMNEINAKLDVLLVYAAPLHHKVLAANVVLHLHHQVEVSLREVLHERRTQIDMAMKMSLS